MRGPAPPSRVGAAPPSRPLRRHGAGGLLPGPVPPPALPAPRSLAQLQPPQLVLTSSQLRAGSPGNLTENLLRRTGKPRRSGTPPAPAPAPAQDVARRRHALAPGNTARGGWGGCSGAGKLRQEAKPLAKGISSRCLHQAHRPWGQGALPQLPSPPRSACGAGWGGPAGLPLPGEPGPWLGAAPPEAGLSPAPLHRPETRAQGD